MGWRDETPQPVQGDLDRLAGAALDAAAHFLDTKGELLPFAIVLGADGESRLAAADPGEGEHPAATAVLALLYRETAARREALRAVAFVSPVETTAGDAVRVELEHRDGGPALQLFSPYAVDAAAGVVRHAQPTAAAGERRVWV